ncbi:hypothetical protein CVU82_03125 [Candidatus Falkowbacteria bacterium HGW-Falkowbacteria-1]|jgi:hypothetical protein|uniref:Uncharacterized protein n=1 Tax=Candidatus Falkowbacteria bacterium HGW-Falkowbacteria-1 TaxID=2013768 RepID=A0A2N2EA61_9BACT|nr:MAG: hypothetical protein CVU82_03125 [Candidatus Falkowbacteria bacterium HGW-Falkowbacteria-1]
MGEIKKITPLDYIYEGEEMVGVKTTEYGELRISYWEEKEIRSFDNVEFKIPSMFGKFMKFVPERVRLWKNGEFQKMLPHWMYGVFVKGVEKDVLVTRCYYHSDPSKTSENLPFGQTVVGSLEMKFSTNTKTGEKKLILNFVYGGSREKAQKRVIIDGKPDETKPNFQITVPGSGGKKITVVNI